MVSRLGCAVLLVALACGKQNSTSQQGAFYLSVPSGTQISAKAQTETDVLLVAVGADGAVAYTLTGAPQFVSLADAVLKIAPALADLGKTFTFSVTVATATQSDTVSLSVVVTARPDTPPQLITAYVTDVRNAELSSGIGAHPGCYQAASLSGTMKDLATEQDPALIEVEVVPAGTPFSRVATLRSPLFSAYRLNVFLDYELDLHLPLEHAIDLAFRAVDVWGDASAWMNYGRSVYCSPIAFALGASWSKSCARGATCALTYAIDGATGPVEITATGLPSWAAFSGATLTVSPPLDAVGPLEFDATATADGHNAYAHVSVTITSGQDGGSPDGG
jgi:hypothetical protein